MAVSGLIKGIFDDFSLSLQEGEQFQQILPTRFEGIDFELLETYERKIAFFSFQV